MQHANQHFGKQNTTHEEFTNVIICCIQDIGDINVYINVYCGNKDVKTDYSLALVIFLNLINFTDNSSTNNSNNANKLKYYTLKSTLFAEDDSCYMPLRHFTCCDSYYKSDGTTNDNDGDNLH